jgi:branched-chain amino acid transport system permease protein
LLIRAPTYLKTLMAGIPVLAEALHPDRWMLRLGVLFVLSIYFPPTGIVGKLRGHLRPH